MASGVQKVNGSVYLNFIIVFKINQIAYNSSPYRIPYIQKNKSWASNVFHPILLIHSSLLLNSS